MQHRSDDACRVLLLLAFAGSFALAGCGVRAPSSLETKAAASVKHHITIRNKGEKNPLPDDVDTLERGKKAFSFYCVSCHGLDGQKTGVPFADRMSPPVPSLADAEVQAYTEGQLKWIIDNGIYPSGMPASKGMLSDDEIWSIIHFIRHLPRKGSLGDPKFYSGE